MLMLESVIVMINIQSNSRKIKKGDTFIALRGISSDGHSYINNAIENGATKIIVEEKNMNYDVETIVVPDTRKYLNKYLQENYNKFLDKMCIIGVTGTNGKTTSAMLIHDALNMIGKKTAYIGTVGFYIGEKIKDLPNTTVDICDMYDLLMYAYDNGCENVVMEVSSHGLATGRCETLVFDYAIFTNLTQDHLDYHKTMENYALAKQSLFKKLKDTSKAIINIDDSYKDYFLLDNNQNITYGFSECADYRITKYHMTDKKTQFTYKFNDREYDLEMKLLGKYNLYNMLSVITLLSTMGIDINVQKDIIPALKAPVGRMETIEYNDNTIIIDYAHTEDAIEKIVLTFKELCKGNIYIVFGCTGDRDRTKRPKMTKLVGCLSKYFIITNDDPHNEDPNQIVQDMIKDYEYNNYEICLDRKEAIIKGINLLEKKDMLFILGKGHEEVMIVGKERIPFNDKKTVISYLEEVK